MVNGSVSKISSTIIVAPIIVEFSLEMKTCLQVNSVLVNKLFLCIKCNNFKIFFVVCLLN